MKKQFLLAGVALSLFLLGYGILWPGGSAAMPMPQETPILTLDKDVAEKPVTDLDDDGKVDPGDTISYTITYSNTGEITATNVILVDDYDETLIESVANVTGGGNDDENAITWDLGALAGGEGDSVSYEATLKSIFPPGSVNLENAATIDSDETDPVSATSAVPVEGPNLTILKGRAETIVDDLGVAGVIDAGDTIKYVITYENIGDVDGTNVKIVDHYEIDSIANIANVSHEGVDDGETITWHLGTVEAGGKGQVTYEAKLKDTFPQATDVKNEATISSDGVEPRKAEAIVRAEVAPTPTPTLVPTPSPAPTPVRETTRENVLVAVPGLTNWIFALALTCLVMLVVASTVINTSDQEGRHRMRQLQEGVCLVLIAVIVAILRLTACITEEGTLTILSGIVGYVLGRTVGEARGGPGAGQGASTEGPTVGKGDAEEQPPRKEGPPEEELPPEEGPPGEEPAPTEGPA